MRRASVAATGFALAGGAAADPGRAVYVASVPDQFGRVLLISAEPLDPTPRGLELASVALRVIRETFAATPGAAADALMSAFSAANAAIISENRSLTMGRRERRVCVGATAVVICGRDIIVAQAAPSQAIVVQDDRVYGFPDVASWRGDYVPESPAHESQPLGFGDEASPQVFHSEAAPGDVIALCSTSIGRTLGRDDDAAVELYGGRMLTGDLEGSIDRLERLLARHDVVDGFALVATVTRLPRRSRQRPALPLSRQGGARIVRANASASAVDAQAPASPLNSSATVARPDLGEEDRPPPFEGVRDAVIGIVEAASSLRRTSAPRFDSRQRAIAAPGALSVSRYRDASGLPAEWRANLPRTPGLQVPARLLAVSLVVFLAVGGTGFAWNHQRDQEARAEASLDLADTALQQALEIPGSASTLVAEAAGALDDARQAGAGGEALARREAEFARVRDEVWHVRRLSDVERLGALPRELGGGPVRLAFSGSALYIASGDLFELDPDERRLVALLSQDDAVEGGTAGALRDVSVDGGQIVASDGTATYTRDKKGRWQRQELAVADVGGLRSDAPLISWAEAAYGVSWDGDIVRFEASAGGAMADIWAAAADNPDLELARDLAIDGRIHVLLSDGRVLTYSRGTLETTLSPFTVPTLNKAAFLAQAPFASAFYIVDPTASVGENTGRIVRADAAGNTWQYLAPDGGEAASALATARDMAIDELTGTVYWIAGDEIWQARLPMN